MLLFSRRSKERRQDAAVPPPAATNTLHQQPLPDIAETEPAFSNETTPTPPTARTWLSTLRKRTLSVDSFTNIFSNVALPSSSSVGAGRKSSLNSQGNGSISSMGGTTKLMRSHKMQLKSGESVDLYFGYDALSMNGRSIAYGEIVFWSHSASHFTMTFLVKNTAKRKDIALYPTAHGPKPSEITDMLSMRIARLLADQTGCSEERAVRLATTKANDLEVKQATDQLDQHVMEEKLMMNGSTNAGARLHGSATAKKYEDGGGEYQQRERLKSRLTRDARTGSGIIEVSTEDNNTKQQQPQIL